MPRIRNLVIACKLVPLPLPLPLLPANMNLLYTVNCSMFFSSEDALNTDFFTEDSTERTDPTNIKQVGRLHASFHFQFSKFLSLYFGVGLAFVLINRLSALTLYICVKNFALRIKFRVLIL